MSLPLAGVRVVEYAQYVAGPLCGVGQVEQQGLGAIDLLAPFIRVGGAKPSPSAAPELGADTDAVLSELA